MDDNRIIDNLETTGMGNYRSRSRAFCILCDKPVDLLTFDRAVDDLKTSYAEVHKIAENRKLHRINNSKGVVMVCAESLFSYLEGQQTVRLPADLFITNPTDSFA
ncbi:MAG: hypothetical protein HKN25_13845 [Pyrinomonadaceae bacterium]|nr:hypothetical protein [Pyrinomonadaceae bacterium]